MTHLAARLAHLEQIVDETAYPFAQTDANLRQVAVNLQTPGYCQLCGSKLSGDEVCRHCMATRYTAEDRARDAAHADHLRRMSE